ncbi:hypothetical protein ASF63_15530 [Microbacterium sp. Leaf320]|nr:hypothetical protein ASF63_15530 [Microbacterium sp. Leaf320]
MGDWVEFVICGTRTCADGSEDFDGNGVSDAAELAACVVRVDDLAITGAQIAWLLVLVAAVLLTTGGLLWGHRRRAARTPAAGDDFVDSTTEGL